MRGEEGERGARERWERGEGESVIRGVERRDWESKRTGRDREVESETEKRLLCVT